MEDQLENMNGEVEQRFVVTITWSPGASSRLTEGDISEVIEEVTLEVDEEAVVDVMEGEKEDF